MPRAEPGTPKWLANKMKAKGLQKLKWYCQMCEKQCRDENGFKCHRLSEGHIRQMQVFCEDPNRFMDEYSRLFEKEFMRLMKTRFCRTRVLANTVYTNLISDKSHIHMNATIWFTLTDFVLYLGNTGKCKIESTERGWYLEYIDREKIEREKVFLQKKKVEYTHEQKKEKRIQEIVEEAQNKGTFIEPEYTGLQKKSEDKIVISNWKIKKTDTDTFDNEKNKKNESEERKTHTGNIFLKESFKKLEQLKKKELGSVEKDKELSSQKKRPLSAMELLVLENEEKKRMKLETQKKMIPKQEPLRQMKDSQLLHDMKNELANRNEKESTWLCENIVVKIIDKKHKYYKKKGVIISIRKDDKTKCTLELDDKQTCTAYQKQVQTVIPKIGGKVLILRGKYKGLTAKIQKIKLEKESVEVLVDHSQIDSSSKHIVECLPYDNVSKISKR